MSLKCLWLFKFKKYWRKCCENI